MKESELVERLRRLGGMLDTTRLESTEVLRIADLIEAQAKEVEEKRGLLKWVVNAYADANPLRLADMHSSSCKCLRCAVDEVIASHSQEGEQG